MKTVWIGWNYWLTLWAVFVRTPKEQNVLILPVFVPTELHTYTQTQQHSQILMYSLMTSLVKLSWLVLLKIIRSENNFISQGILKTAVKLQQVNPVNMVIGQSKKRKINTTNQNRHGHGKQMYKKKTWLQEILISKVKCKFLYVSTKSDGKYKVILRRIHPKTDTKKVISESK